MKAYLVKSILVLLIFNILAIIKTQDSSNNVCSVEKDIKCSENETCCNISSDEYMCFPGKNNVCCNTDNKDKNEEYSFWTCPQGMVCYINTDSGKGSCNNPK